MAQSPYDTDLDRNPANFQPLTPLSFLERSAQVYPDRIAIIHGPIRRTYRDFHVRSKRLASALAARGIGKGDTVAVMLANTPAMLECHYGVPMTGAVLNTLNTRLDAAIIAFSLDHGEAKVLITDREFAETIVMALAHGERQAVRHRLRRSGVHRRRRAARRIEYEAFLGAGDPDFAERRAGGRVGRDLAELHIGHDRQSQGRRLPSPRRRTRVCAKQRRDLRHGHCIRLYLWTLPMFHCNGWCFPCSISVRRGHGCLPCDRFAPPRRTTRSPNIRSPTFAAPRS